jgi:hypothetical protein
VEEEMDDETHEVQKASSIKPPMIKPPMVMSAIEPPAQPVETAARVPAPSFARSQAPPAAESSNKLVMVINFILLAALIVGLAILAYRWLK